MDNPIPSAPGIEYQEAHGMRLFRCTAHGATLTDRACLANYRLAKSALRTNYRPHLQHCAYCPIGACHAGEKPRVRSSAICPRCHRSGLRLILSHGLCVSCYNRQGELKRGKNARGNLPIELLQRAPVPHSIVFMHEGKLVRFDRLAVDSFEPMLAALLLAKKPESVTFVFGRGKVGAYARDRDWQRPNAVMARRALDRDRTKKRVDSERCGTS